MNDKRLPDYLKQGERARLFPVLSVTSKEGRTTSILLGCLDKIDEFAATLLAPLGVRVGKRAEVETFTEIVFRNQIADLKERPDGLIVVKTSGKEWRALLEAKIGNSELGAAQIEKYRALAKENGVDCVITLSNQFATDPKNHPLEEVRKSRSRIPVYHWSWMHVLTTADLLVTNEEITDRDQRVLLNELRRFLTHDSAGVRGFDRMPPEWSDVNKLVSSGGRIPARSEDATRVIEAWHQETKDLALILSRLTETRIRERLTRKHRDDPGLRQRDELSALKDTNCLSVTFDIPDAAAPMEVVADLTRRTVDVGMTLMAPADRKSSKARANWLLRQIKTERADDLFVRMIWPGRSENTQFPLSELRANPGILDEGKEHLQVVAFHVFKSRRFGARFTQVSNFITDLEKLVPEFYDEIGSHLTEFKRSAPRIKPERSETEDVSVAGLSEISEAYEEG